MKIDERCRLTDVCAWVDFDVDRVEGDAVICTDVVTGQQRIFPMMQARQMKIRFKRRNVCPHCGSRIEQMNYTEYSRVVWKNGRWVKDDSGAVSDYECFECGHTFDVEELEAMGVFD